MARRFISIAWMKRCAAWMQPRLRALAARGLKLYACAYGAQQRGLERNPHAIYAGLASFERLDRRRRPICQFQLNECDESRRSLDHRQRPARQRTPGEAVRLAAGLGAWHKVDVTVYLRGPAVLILGQNAVELTDGENDARYLPALLGPGRPLTSKRGLRCFRVPGAAAVPFEEISDAQLAALAAGRSCVLRF